MSVHRGNESFQQLGGLDNLKAFCLRAMRRQGEGSVRNRPRGLVHATQHVATVTVTAGD